MTTIGRPIRVVAIGYLHCSHVEGGVPTVLADLVAEVARDHTPGPDCFTLEQLREELAKSGVVVGLSRAKQIAQEKGFRAFQFGRMWYWRKTGNGVVKDE